MSNRKKKHFSKLAGASSAPRLEWLTSAVPGWRLASSASSTSRQPLQSSHLQPTNNPPVAAAARTVIWWTQSGEHSDTLGRHSQIRDISHHPALSSHLLTFLRRRTEVIIDDGNTDQIWNRKWENINNIMLADCFFANIKLIKMRLSHWKEKKPYRNVLN